MGPAEAASAAAGGGIPSYVDRRQTVDCMNDYMQLLDFRKSLAQLLPNGTEEELSKAKRIRDDFITRYYDHICEGARRMDGEPPPRSSRRGIL